MTAILFIISGLMFAGVFFSLALPGSSGTIAVLAMLLVGVSAFGFGALLLAVDRLRVKVCLAIEDAARKNS